MNADRVITSVRELREAVLEVEGGLLTIKPRVTFESVERSQGRPISISAPIPSSQIGSVTLLEAYILVSLLKVLRPKVVFEFGTFLGYMTSVFALNIGREARVLSIDLPPSGGESTVDFQFSSVLSDFRVNDRYLTSMRVEQGTPYLSDGYSCDVGLLEQDSRSLDPDALGLVGQCGLIFVDGGHSTEVAAADTRNALRMLASPGCVAWHDFGSALHTEVDAAVLPLAESRLILRVESTMLALYLDGGALEVITS